ncbi:uncharacterized protein LOC120106007 [Phoenix dactylifera]|uniref:Uncharacterized protein LOC120106007 n=1 Tax=Phoenix dactylifera TaxID=42345 RepID=A0A8B8ZN54_PHODC|nr:uncharacterized protein LOC120106007 [Phoenix dactylifera]
MAGDWMTTFVTRIPKHLDEAEPSHYKPISLCTTLYKVVIKILVDRMKPLLYSLIYQEQRLKAFVRGQSITDNVLIAQKMIWDLQRAPRQQCYMAVKLDMKRAYDRVC